MTETKTVEVTQADREAFRSICLLGDVGPNVSTMLAAGAWDDDHRMQEIARHRLASQSLSSDIEAERLRAWADVQAERKRQIEAEGWTPAHDDEHDDAELLAAALCYGQSALGAVSKPPFRLDEPPALWPWDAAWWKPANPRRDLVRAAALILAEIERIDRAAALKETPNVG